MNILYISKGSSNPWAGPTYSVPKQVKAQTEWDNVFWYDLTYSDKLKYQENVSMWKETGVYHDLNEFPDESISSLPSPFNNPDLIVFERFYIYTTSKIRHDAALKRIPYVIIPRGELTRQAQQRKKLKKSLANFALMRRFARSAAAIEYLSEQEKIDSGCLWNQNSLVIPNGVSLYSEHKTSFNREKIKIVSIGRIEKYQKGIDLLLEAVKKVRNELIQGNVTIDIYGPDKEGQSGEILKYIQDNEIEQITKLHGPVFGDEKVSVLLNSDIFIMPSRFEGLPTALIEALALGLPCIASTGSNMRREIEEHKAGWGCDTTADSIAETLLTVLRDRNVLSEYGENAQMLSHQYDWNTIAKNSHRAYAQIIRSGK